MFNHHFYLQLLWS